MVHHYKILQAYEDILNLLTLLVCELILEQRINKLLNAKN